MDFADEGGDTIPIDNTAKPGQEPAAPVELAKPPVAPAPPQAAPVQTQAPAATTVPPQAPTPAPAAQTPASPVPAGDQEDPYLKAWKDGQEKITGELEKYYALDDDTAEALLSDPKTAMPKLLAKLHLAVMQNTYKTVLDRLPPLMEATAQTVKMQSAAEDRFYKSWPVFKQEDPAQRTVLMQYGQMFRQMNPAASEADFTKYVGAAAAAHLGLKMPARAANGKGKPIPYSPSAASAPASGGGEPKPTQFEDMFSAVLGNQE